MSAEPLLAHGVGRVYQAPLPLWLYLVGAAATVAASFLLRAVFAQVRPLAPERRLAGETFVLVYARIGKAVALGALALTVVSAAFSAGEGLSLASLLFWVGLVIGTTFANAVVAGTWETVDPWATLERAYRAGEPPPVRHRPPWWLAPLTVYALFWFELVSGVGFEAFWVLVALLVYSLFVLSFRSTTGERWGMVDPLAVLFRYAARCAPLRLRADGLYYKGVLRELDVPEPMPRALFAALFVLLGSTTLDNVRETVGWSEFRRAVGLAAAPSMLVDSVALAAFALAFFIPFLVTVRAAHRFIGKDSDPVLLARRLGWSLVPIGIAYVLAHNAPLVMTGIPTIVRGLSDPLGRGWDLLGTAGALQGFFPSPALVWFLEIALIVGGHVVAVMAAHRTAVAVGGSHAAAVRSQWALTALMSLFTIATLWLLSQPLVG